MKSKKVIYTIIAAILVISTSGGFVIYYILQARKPSRNDSDKTTTTTLVDNSKSSGALNYPELPLSSTEVESYYELGFEEFDVVFYAEKDTETYAKGIEPIGKPLIAYSYYQFEKYKELFKYNASEKIQIRVYETVELLNSSVFGIPDQSNNPNGIISFSKQPNYIYYFFDYKNVDIPTEHVATAATHEMTHILENNYSELLTSSFPDWYKEGICQYYQYYPSYMSDKVGQDYPGNYYDLKAVLFDSDNAKDIVQAYGTSYEFVKYLIDLIGEEEFLSLLDKYSLNFDEEFEKKFAASPDEMYKEFLEDITN